MRDTVTEKYDIIILAGQSNAEGQGIGAVTREFVPDKRIHFMKDDANPKFVTENGVTRLVMKWPATNSICVADERITENGKTGCFALQFAEQYAQTYLSKDRKVLIVNANFGGTGFARPEWGIGNPMHTRMIAMTNEALAGNPENRVVAILWDQGEHDAFENADWDHDRRYATHKKNLTATFADLYEKIGDQSVPLIACGFTDAFCHTLPEATDAVLRAIREVIADFGGSFVQTHGLATNSEAVPDSKDIYHFSRESLHILGQMVFEKYRQMRK